MRIIANEVKKIFNFKNIVILMISSLIVWNLFIYFEIDNFPNGQPNNEHYNNAVIMLNKYGTSMDEKEFKDYKKLREEKAQKATDYLLKDKDAISLGIKSYNDYIEKLDNDLGNEKIQNLHSKIMFEENIAEFWDLQAMDYEIDRYEDKESWVGLSQDINKEQLKRKKEVINSEQVNSPLNFIIFRNYNQLILSVTTLILISIAIMISPIFSNDNRNKLNYIHYSSKIGRKLFKKKIMSGLISATVIVTIQLGIFFMIYKSNNTFMFWDCSINSVFSDVLSWFDLTFGQYIILSVVIVYILALVYSTIAMFISSKVNNNIGLIGCQIPILYLIGPRLSDIMDFIAFGTSVYVHKYTLILSLLIAIIIGISLMILAYKKEKYLDI